LLLGDWDYMDDDDMLFTSQLLDRSTVGEKREGDKFFGVDVADKGKDKTVVSYMVDGILVEQKHLQVDTSGEKAISELYALELIKFCQQRGITANEARRIGLEGNGVGVGMRDFMRTKGWFVSVYEATAKSRSAAYYAYHKDMDSGDAQIWNQLETMDELRKELMVLTYEFDENLEPKVLQKKKVKEELGYSPDYSDSAMIANWIRRGGVNDPKNDTSRIVF